MKPSEAVQEIVRLIARVGAGAGVFVNVAELKDLVKEAFEPLDPSPVPILAAELQGGNVYATEHATFKRVLYYKRMFPGSIKNHYGLIEPHTGISVVYAQDKQTVAAWLTRYKAVLISKGEGDTE